MTVITLLTDFGIKDSYVAEMKGVILQINPKATIVDISHDVGNYNIESGAFHLARSVPYFPEETVHIGVVDPGVGGTRKRIIIKTGKAHFIGPDNGLLAPAAERLGIQKVYEITNMEILPERVSEVFDGRDVFSPTGAYLSKGESPEKFGKEITEYLRLPSYHLEIGREEIQAKIIHIDGFGNAVTNVTTSTLSRLNIKDGDILEIELKQEEKKVPYVKNFSAAPKGEPLLVVAGGGYLELAVNQGNAQEVYGINRGDEIKLKIT